MRLILIILLIYAIFSFIMRYVVPSLMRKYVNDFQKQFTGQNQRTNQEENLKKEGEVSITYVEKDKNKTHNPDDADYVDYEEIK
jgi:uncharacterized ion transporter superfamily protein YfcC